ncbi:hypothetical protein BH23DEI1_BH23DEI1_21940 [soil metagenome]
MVRHHAATERIHQDQMLALIGDAGSRQPDHDVAAALERGRTMRLDVVAQGLLQSRPIPDAASRGAEHDATEHDPADHG